MPHMRGIHSMELVTVLALIEYLVLGVMVGQARGRYKIEAPATTGDPMFERYFRVHQNTLESLIVFLPALWLCGLTLTGRGAALLGLLYIVARVVYVRGYLADPKGRAAGAMMTFAANGLLLIGSLIGVFVYR